MNFKDFEGAKYRVIIVCLLANKIQGGKTIARVGKCPPHINETLALYRLFLTQSVLKGRGGRGGYL